MRAKNDFEDIERILLQTGRKLVYPATPPIHDRVRRRLSPGPVPRHRSGAHFVGAIALAVVLALLTLVAWPESRTALARILGMRLAPAYAMTPTATGTRASFLVASPTTDSERQWATPTPDPVSTLVTVRRLAGTTLNNSLLTGAAAHIPAASLFAAAAVESDIGPDGD